MRANFIISEVLNGLRRNATMTIAMIITTAITLGMFGGGLLVIQMADKSQQIFLDRVEMEFYLNPEVTERDPQCEADPCAQQYLPMPSVFPRPTASVHDRRGESMRRPSGRERRGPVTSRWAPSAPPP